MLKISGAEDPLGQKKARELQARQPKVVRHTKAWVDDKELCLEVECVLDDGSSMLIEMKYCWDAGWGTSLIVCLRIKRPTTPSQSTTKCIQRRCQKPAQALRQTAGRDSFLGPIAHRCPAAAELDRSATEGR
jgi:hypothetical protein